MQTGVVKFFNETKGFGFITSDQTGKDVFVHITALNGMQINEWDKVTFEVEQTQKWENAQNVQLA